MVYTDDEFDYIMRLNKGERWSDAFSAFTKETKLDGGWVSLIGGVLEVTLGYYSLEKKEYKWQTFEGLREITGAQGNVSMSERKECTAHLHGTFADENYQVIGGHIKDFVAGATVEVYMHRFDKPLWRKTDPDIGLQTLDL